MSDSDKEPSFLTREFFQRAPEICAADLVGCLFQWCSCAGRIVETEAYAEFGDEACHTFFKPSAREFVGKYEAGTAYVYLNYGMYWLTNVLCKDPTTGKNGFVLLRALEPVRGIPLMKRRRGREKLRDLCSGPGKLSAALAIKKSAHGKCFVTGDKGGFYPDKPPEKVTTDRRVGISRAQELEWRFLEKDNPHLSVAFGKA